MYKSIIKYCHCFLLALFFLILFSGCNATKHLSDDEYLLRQNKVRVDTSDHDISRRDLRPLVRQRPNKKVAGFRLHLGLHNLAGKKDSRWNRWLKRMGERPVIYDPFMVERSKQVITNYMVNRGYRDAEVSDTLLTKGQKATVKYYASPGRPQYINQFNYDIFDSSIADIIMSDTLNRLLEGGDYFDIGKMEEERQRLVTLLKNNGYYLLNRDHIYYEADTIGLSYLVNLTLGLRPFRFDSSNVTIERTHPVFKVRQVYVVSGYDPNRYLEERERFFIGFDTLYRDGVAHVYKDEMAVKPGTINNALRVYENQLYSLEESDRTYGNLVNLKTFRLVNVRFIQTQLEQEKDTGYIDCHILLNTAMPQSYSLDIEGTNYQGNLGFASNLMYNHKNLFRGAESFSIKLRGAMETLQSPDETGIENTIELGGDVRLSTPKMIVPFRMDRFVSRYNPRTTFVLGYNYQQRPDYTRTISNAQVGYHWQQNNTWNYFFNPLEFDLVRLPESEQTERFRDEIRGTYLANSFNDHLILGSRYFFTYNRPAKSFQRNRLYLRYSLENGGNILNLYHSLTNEEQVDDSYRIFDVEYTQYVKTDIDVRNYITLNNTDQVATRFFFGIAVPYGNSSALPFEKQYFAGGANSLRAWQVRTLGPGSSMADTLTRFPNSFGDIRLEANIEYRFHMFWLLEGALFCDIGNIWALSEDEDAKAGFNMGDFYKELALGIGAGIRLDFSFFVLRFDYGVKARDPVMPAGERGVLRDRGVGPENGNLVFSIGYPF